MLMTLPADHFTFDSDTPILSFENLCKSYMLGSVELKVLQDINLTISRGEYIAIMGPSGSGKSTLLNMIGCLDRPSSGKYWLGGQEVSRLDDNQLSLIRGKRIGFVFQSFNLISQLNIIENIEIPMFYQGFSEHESAAKAKELAEMIGLGDRLKHRPTELSGGQQQRVAIARCFPMTLSLSLLMSLPEISIPEAVMKSSISSTAFISREKPLSL